MKTERNARFKACSIEGCARNSHYTSNGARGLCELHYARLRRLGDPLAGGTFEGEPMRFVHEVAVHYKGDDCLSWPFGKDRHGYGKLRVNGRAGHLAHRYVCELVHGEPPSPVHEAAHGCGNGHEGCVNPNHLRWATPQENADDRVLHGTSGGRPRQPKPKAEERAV